MKAVGVIPARFASTRLPGKPLLDETGKPLVQHVWERARAASTLDSVLIATDDPRVAEAAKAFGADARMTGPAHRTGTDRVAEVAATLSCEVVVNIQGDEPEIEPGDIDAAVRALAEHPEAMMSTLACRTTDAARAADPAVVKVACDGAGRALYFSRAAIPRPRDPEPEPAWLLHLGLYAYRREFLLEFARMEQTPLEKAEQLEQLRALENGVAIQVVETRSPAFGIDTPADYQAFVARHQRG